MGDEDQRPLVGLKGFEKDRFRVEVEVVRRLVEEENVRRLEQHPGQSETALLSPGEDLHPLVDVVSVEQERPEDAPELRHHGDGGALVHALEEGLVFIENRSAPG